MKKITLFFVLLMYSIGFSQSFPIDFENSEDEFSDAGSTFSIISDPTGSGRVMIGEINGGAGLYDNVQKDLSTISGGTYLDVTNASTNSITFDIYTSSTDVMTGLLQLTDRMNLQDGANVPIEVGFTTNGAIGWETIVLDFDSATNGYPYCSGCGQDKPVVLDQFQKIVLFTDFAVTKTGIYYIDDLTGPNGDPISMNLIDFYSEDFELGSTGWSGEDATTFSNAFSNPDTGGLNSSSTVAQIDGINVGAYTNAQVTLSDNFDFSAGDKGFSIMVRGPRSVPVKFKVEGSGTSAERDLTYTDVGNWQELVYDFRTESSTSWNTIVVFFDITGTPSVDGADDIFLFDNVEFAAYSTLSNKSVTKFDYKLFPNPTQDSWNISSQNKTITSIKVYDVLGKNVLSVTPNEREAIINGAGLKSGMYFAKIDTGLGSSSIKLVKQ